MLSVYPAANNGIRMTPENAIKDANRNELNGVNSFFRK